MAFGEMLFANRYVCYPMFLAHIRLLFHQNVYLPST